MNPHYFIAVDLPEEVALKIDNWCRKNNRESFKTWVHKEDYHLTLAFLGGIADKILKEQLVQEVASTVRAFSPFSLTLSQLQTFGLPYSPRVLWFGVYPSKELEQLRKQIYTVCENLGFQLDQRPFTPHITLARKWHAKTPYHPLEHEVIKNTIFHVDGVYLFETHPLNSPKYRRVVQFEM
ncbi:RNA 2',3'-cyclic phosphodiesterase [Bacillus kexueae]|uniref:RNA 2',3'-cyclic phosphodiesterase n=1 Tax=Aeribacillus kexueae TaxID=2078952 RepID=UPI001FB02282